LGSTNLFEDCLEDRLPYDNQIPILASRHICVQDPPDPINKHQHQTPSQKQQGILLSSSLSAFNVASHNVKFIVSEYWLAFVVGASVAALHAHLHTLGRSHLVAKRA
jgi:hypothetical protein